MHRFDKDPMFGVILQRWREIGPPNEDVALLNERVVGSRGGPSEEDIPDDVIYAVKTNFDRNAINDAVFAEHLKKTHFKSERRDPPSHTIVILASHPKSKKSGKKGSMSNSQRTQETSSMLPVPMVICLTVTIAILTLC